MSILAYFSEAYVINLRARTDRRRDVEVMFDRVGLTDWRERVEFFPAVRPDSAGGFATLGARGCFLSHLGILRRVAEKRGANVLIMEDDLEIDPRIVASTGPIIETLGREAWGFAYLGHILGDDPEGAAPLAPYRGMIQTTHFVAVSASVVPRVVDYLEQLLRRPAGHPEGGPMDVDGAYSCFRVLHPDVMTLVARPSLGSQRASSSDAHPIWIDRVPGARHLTNTIRALKRRLKA